MTQKQKTYGDVSIKKLDKSQVEIVGSIPHDTWEIYRAQALKNINESVNIDGFRKGMVPENVLLSKVGEMAVLEEMAEMALSPAYLDIIMENKIDAIGRPDIVITKLAKGNPLEFKITSAVVPEVALPDYKKLAQEQLKKQDKKEVIVTEKDLEDTIKRILSTATKAKSNPNQGADDDEDAHAGHDHDHSDHNHNHDHGHDSHEHTHEHDHNNEHNQKQDNKDAGSNPVASDAKNTIPEVVLPELTDAFVKQLGDFTDVNDFKEKIKVLIADQKRDQAEEKLRIAIADSISEGSTTQLPEILVQSETSRIETQFNDDLARMGVKLEDYLKHSKKTIEDLRQEWKPHAEKKAKLQLVLNAIAQKENIKPSTEEVENEVDHILEHYADADREKAATYAETVLTNEKVFEFLEKSAV